MTDYLKGEECGDSDVLVDEKCRILAPPVLYTPCAPSDHNIFNLIKYFSIMIL